MPSLAREPLYSWLRDGRKGACSCCGITVSVVAVASIVALAVSMWLTPAVRDPRLEVAQLYSDAAIAINNVTAFPSNFKGAEFLPDLAQSSALLGLLPSKDMELSFILRDQLLPNLKTLLHDPHACPASRAAIFAFRDLAAALVSYRDTVRQAYTSLRSAATTYRRGVHLLSVVDQRRHVELSRLLFVKTQLCEEAEFWDAVMYRYGDILGKTGYFDPTCTFLTRFVECVRLVASIKQDNAVNCEALRSATAYADFVEMAGTILDGGVARLRLRR